jgi:chromate transporter
MNDAIIGYRQLFAVFGRIGLLSFGGPAGQIALMHTVLVDEKKWLDEKRFLHALNFCMLLPGPEAMQLATYSGWLKRGVWGGLIAGVLFVLPGFAVLLALSMIYAAFGDVPAIAGLLFGLKAAVLAIVLQALHKVAKRALKGWESVALAIAAFIALAAFQMPFPIVIALAGLAGWLMANRFAQHQDEAASASVDKPLGHVAGVLAWAVLLWLLPLAVLLAALGRENVFAAQALFFSQTAIVTFGGAYAVLAYVGQQAVEVYRWLSPGEMLTGLGLAETTPGPLILVLVFVGFLGAYRDAGMPGPMTAGILGAVLTAWFTFVPCFIWVFLGAPFMERLRGNKALSGALAAITAAVVGVIANLSVWFALHVLFGEVGSLTMGPVSVHAPVWESFDWRAGVIALAAGIAVWRGLGLGIIIPAAGLAGMVLSLAA